MTEISKKDPRSTSPLRSGTEGDVHELALVEELRRGSARAFDLFYEREKAVLYGFLRRLCRDQAEADDVFQETWLAVAQASVRLKPGSRLRAWLFQIARNRFRMRRRNSNERRVAENEPDEHANENDVEEQWAAALDLKAVNNSLVKLDVDLREALLLSVVDDLSSSEAAVLLGIEEAAFRKRVSRARHMLHRLLSEVSR